jgi:large subunit ribosomal protein L3
VRTAAWAAQIEIAMNQHPGVVGRKLGMTQLFAEDGTVLPCTVIEARPIVVAKRTQAKDGYDALVLGIEERKEKHTTKPMAGSFKKAGVTPQRVLREFRCTAEHAAKFEVGAALSITDVFEEGQFVDVQGVTRGRGFSGVVRRHHFAGNVQTHGTHEYRRHGGSIGQRKTPGRTFPGMRMPGQHGNWTLSVMNQRIVKLVPEKNLVLVVGGVPGSRNSVVVVRGATRKKNGGKAKAG